jgi:hypothetical protein
VFARGTGCPVKCRTYVGNFCGERASETRLMR